MRRFKQGFWTRVWFVTTICLLISTAYLVVKVQDYKRRWWTSRLHSSPILEGRPLLKAPVADQITLLLVGDSRVESWKPTVDPAKFFVINRGMGGSTSGEVLAATKADLSSGESPAWVVVQCGINDILGAGYDPKLLPKVTQQVVNNIAEINALCLRSGSIVILTTIIPHGPVGLRDLFFWTSELDAAVASINEEIRKLATERTLILDAAKLLAEGNRTKSTFCVDGLHLNDAGYAKLSVELGSLLVPAHSN